VNQTPRCSATGGLITGGATLTHAVVPLRRYQPDAANLAAVVIVIPSG
jgi:hypothetical protein